MSKKNKSILAVLAVAVVAVAAFAALSSANSSSSTDSVTAQDLKVFSASPALSDSETAERSAVLGVAKAAPDESNAHSIDTSELVPVDVPGESAHAWVAPTSDGGVAIFVPENGTYSFAHSPAGDLTRNGAVSVATGASASGAPRTAIAVVVAAPGAPTPTVESKDGSSRDVTFSDNVAVANLTEGDTLHVGAASIPVPSEADQLARVKALK